MAAWFKKGAAFWRSAASSEARESAKFVYSGLQWTYGPSMMPTLNEMGDVLIVDKLSPRFQSWMPLRRNDIIIADSSYKADFTVCKRIVGLPGDAITPPHWPAPVVVPEGHVWIEGDNPLDSVDSRYYGPIPCALIRGRVLAKVWPLTEARILVDHSLTNDAATTAGSSSSSSRLHNDSSNGSNGSVSMQAAIGGVQCESGASAGGIPSTAVTASSSSLYTSSPPPASSPSDPVASSSSSPAIRPTANHTFRDAMMRDAAIIGWVKADLQARREAARREVIARQLAAERAAAAAAAAAAALAAAPEAQSADSSHVTSLPSSHTQQHHSIISDELREALQMAATTDVPPPLEFDLLQRQHHHHQQQHQQLDHDGGGGRHPFYNDEATSLRHSLPASSPSSVSEQQQQQHYQQHPALAHQLHQQHRPVPLLPSSTLDVHGLPSFATIVPSTAGLPSQSVQPPQFTERRDNTYNSGNDSVIEISRSSRMNGGHGHLGAQSQSTHMHAPSRHPRNWHSEHGFSVERAALPSSVSDVIHHGRNPRAAHLNPGHGASMTTARRDYRHGTDVLQLRPGEIIKVSRFTDPAAGRAGRDVVDSWRSFETGRHFPDVFGHQTSLDRIGPPSH